MQSTRLQATVLITFRIIGLDFDDHVGDWEHVMVIKSLVYHVFKDSEN